MPRAIGVLLVDRRTLARRCLAAVLSRRRGLTVVGDAESGTEALGMAHELRPDVAVIDPDVPDGGSRLIAVVGSLGLCAQVRPGVGPW